MNKIPWLQQEQCSIMYYPCHIPKYISNGILLDMWQLSFGEDDALNDDVELHFFGSVFMGWVIWMLWGMEVDDGV